MKTFTDMIDKIRVRTGKLMQILMKKRYRIVARRIVLAHVLSEKWNYISKNSKKRN